MSDTKSYLFLFAIGFIMGFLMGCVIGLSIQRTIMESKAIKSGAGYYDSRTAIFNFKEVD